MTLNIVCFSQESFDLNWKLNHNERIAYLTIMEQIDSSEIDLPFILQEIVDSKDFNIDEFFKSFYGEIDNFSMISILQKRKNWTEVCLIRENLNPDTTKNNNQIQQLLKGIQLRGLLNKDGGIESFYTKRDQKNLLAILFQLPSKPVKIGESWELDLTWISTDHNFRCDSMERINEVTLIDVKYEQNDTIALIKYKNHEIINGEFFSPFGGQTIPSLFDMRFDGLCEFSISKGKWKNYSGVVSYYSEGYQKANFKQRFALIEQKEIPEKVLQYLE